MENLDLTNYIQQARKSGMGDNKIREGLLQAGWPVSSVEEAMMSRENLKSEVLNLKQSLKIQNSKTLIRNATFVILVLGIAVAGYFGGTYYIANYQDFPLWPFKVSVPVLPILSPTLLELQNRGSSISQPSSSSSGEIGTTFTPPSNWQTYRNEEYSITLRQAQGD